MKLGRYLLLFFFFCFSKSLFSQDSLDIAEEIDTVVINKDPFVVKKTIYIKDKIKKRRAKEAWLEFAFSPFISFNYYSPCYCSQEYFNEYKRTTSPSIGNYFNANFLYFYSNLIFSTGLSYVTIRENFKFTSTSQEYDLTNKYNYVSIPISVGYRIINHTYFQVIPSAGISIEKLASIHGLIITKEDINKVGNINSEIKYYPYNYRGIIKCKLVFSSLNKTYFALEPNLYGDLRSVTKSSAPFIQQRYNVGISANAIFKIR